MSARDATSSAPRANRDADDVEGLVRRARAGEELSDVDLFVLLQRTEGANDPRAAAMRAVVAPGIRGGAFYLDDAFAPGLRATRAAYVRAEADVASARDRVVAALREISGIDATAGEAIVLRDLYAGPLPDGVDVVHETAEYRRVVVRIDARARDAAFAGLARAEREARRALADALVRAAAGT